MPDNVSSNNSSINSTNIFNRIILWYQCFLSKRRKENYFYKKGFFTIPMFNLYTFHLKCFLSFTQNYAGIAIYICLKREINYFQFWHYLIILLRHYIYDSYRYSSLTDTTFIDILSDCVVQAAWYTPQSLAHVLTFGDYIITPLFTVLDMHIDPLYSLFDIHVHL